MKRLVLILGLWLMSSLPALAQSPGMGTSWAVLGPIPTVATQYFSPYYGVAYRRGCGNVWRHERQEEMRLRQHQWRERERCERWHAGRCRNLGWHERNEWEQLRLHQRAERARFGCW